MMEGIIGGFILGVVASAIVTSGKERNVSLKHEGVFSKIVKRLEGSSYIAIGPLGDDEEVIGKEDAIAIVMEEFYS